MCVLYGTINIIGGDYMKRIESFCVNHDILEKECIFQELTGTP